MPDPFDRLFRRLFHRVFLGDIATRSQLPRDGWVAVRGAAIMRARVAATVLRGQVMWDGATVLSQPGTGRSIQRITQ